MDDRALLDAHAAVHRWLEERAYATIEALVATDVVRARVLFDGFARVLAEHMAFEDERVLPVYTRVAPKDGPGRADHVEGDHTILRRHVDAIVALLDEVEGAPLRAVLERLPVVYRLLGTLEHHTAREQNNVYPALARALPSAIDDVTAALTGLVKRASAT